MKRIIIAILILLLISITITFSVYNFHSVTIKYVLGEFSLPLAVVISCSIIFGILIGLLVNAIILFSMKRKVSKLKRQAESATLELNNLRNMPIKDLP